MRVICCIISWQRDYIYLFLEDIKAIIVWSTKRIKPAKNHITIKLIKVQIPFVNMLTFFSQKSQKWYDTTNDSHEKLITIWEFFWKWATLYCVSKKKKTLYLLQKSAVQERTLSKKVLLDKVLMDISKNQWRSTGGLISPLFAPTVSKSTFLLNTFLK